MYNIMYYIATLANCVQKMKKTTEAIADIKCATYKLENLSPYAPIAIRSQHKTKRTCSRNI